MGTLTGWALLTTVFASLTDMDVIAILAASVIVLAFIGMMGMTIERTAYRPPPVGGAFVAHHLGLGRGLHAAGRGAQRIRRALAHLPGGIAG